MTDFYNDFNEMIDRKTSNSTKWKDCEQNTLAMGLADMDFKSPDCLRNALKKQVEHGIFGYTGEDNDYYQSIINWLNKNHNWKIKKEWIQISPGILSGLGFLINSLTDPGDEIIIQTPVYFCFFSIIRKNERQIVTNPLKLKNGHYTMDYNDLKQKISSNTKMLFLCNPHNPVGRVWKKEELKKLGQLCLENNIIIISDEIHSDLIYPRATHIPFSLLGDEFARNSAVCISPSKTFNFPGLQPGNIIIPDQRLREEYQSIREKYDFDHLNTAAIEATKTVYKEGEQWLRALLEYLEDNLQFLKSFTAEKIPRLNVIEPEGTFLVWLDFRNYNISSRKLSFLLKEKAGLILTPGHVFGKAGEGFQRINIACPRARLKEGLQRLADFMKTI